MNGALATHMENWGMTVSQEDYAGSGGYPHRAEQVTVQTLDGEAVLLDLTTEQYFSLNEVGTVIWELLDGQHSVSELVDTITAEYEAERAEVENDVRDLLTALSSEGLITWTP